MVVMCLCQVPSPIPTWPGCDRCWRSTPRNHPCSLRPDSSWDAVATELQGQGFTVLTPPNLLHGVAADAAYVASFLTQRTTGPVVLVGHSYGAWSLPTPAPQAVTSRRSSTSMRSSPKLARLLFQILGGSGSAFDVPDPNAVFDIVGYPGAPEGDAEAFLKPSTVHDAFAQDLPESDRLLIVASQRPITLGATPPRPETTAWKTLPSWTVIGTEDRVIPPTTQRSMAARAGSIITEVAGSHVSMVPTPRLDRGDPRRRGCYRRPGREGAAGAGARVQTTRRGHSLFEKGPQVSIVATFCTIGGGPAAGSAP